MFHRWFCWGYGFSIAIRFEHKKQDPVLPEKSGSDCEMKIGSRLIRIRFSIAIVIANQIRDSKNLCKNKKNLNPRSTRCKNCSTLHLNREIGPVAPDG